MMLFSRFTAATIGCLVLVSALSIGLFAQTKVPRTETSLPEAARATAQGRAERSPRLVAQTLYSHGEPTAEEQYLLEMINRARANPAEEGIRLSTTTDAEVLASFAYWGVNKDALPGIFQGYPARPPLAFNQKLIAAARRHTADMVAHDFQGHTGSDGSSMSDRIDGAQYNGWTGIGENVSAHAQSLWYAHCGFIVDWGVASLGHRKNVLNYETTVYKEAGFGLTFESNPSTQVGPIVVTEDFGVIPKTAFLCGVAFVDRNKNNFYDVGEGLAGVTITPKAGNFYAVTSLSGGYAIPVWGVTGPVEVTATGGAIGSSVITATVTLNGTDNLKLDFSTQVPPEPVGGLHPSGGMTLTQPSTILSWTPANGSSKYWIECSSDSNFTNITLSDSTLTDTTKALSGFTQGTVVYWRVRARNEVGWGQPSTTAWFSVNLLPPAAQLLLPAPNATLATITPTFIWSYPAVSATRFWLQISEDSLFTTLITNDSTATDTLRVVQGLQNGRTYYWRVRSGNVHGWTAPSGFRMFQIAMLPTKVKLQYPQSGVVIGTLVTLAWTTSQPDVRRYHAQVASDPAFSSLLMDDTAVQALSCSFLYPRHEITYYWRVRAWNTSGYGPFSDLGVFESRLRPSKVLLIGPVSNASFSTDSVRFSWHSASPGILRYKIEIMKLPSGALVLQDSTVTDTTLLVRNLEKDATYSWKVSALNSATWGDPSDTWNFSLSTLALPDMELPRDFTMGTPSPNPARSELTVDYFTRTRGLLRVALYQADGRLVRTSSLGMTDAGAGRTRLSVDGLGSGIYFLHLSIGDQSAVRRVVVER